MTDYPELDDSYLGDWGKHLVKEYGLSVEDAMGVELEAAELYAHDTRNGWCCACDADIAFATSWIKDTPEYQALMIRERRRIENTVYQDCLKKLTVASRAIDHKNKELQQEIDNLNERIAQLSASSRGGK